MTSLRFHLFGAASLGASLLAGTINSQASADISPFRHAFQVPSSQRADFHTSGGATHGDLQGDAFLEEVVYTDGASFTKFYTPKDVHDLFVEPGGEDNFRIRGGLNITRGRPGLISVWGAGGTTAFEHLMVEVMSNRNLNNYIDVSHASPDFSVTIEFERPVRDDDPATSDLRGELLYFERGSGGGNSWLTLQAVNASGAPLGPPLAVSPEETFPTTPVFSVSQPNQKLGGLAIDVSRLGVPEVRFLNVRRTSAAHDGYAPIFRAGIDFHADFKLLGVITHPDDLVTRLGYD